MYPKEEVAPAAHTDHGCWDTQTVAGDRSKFDLEKQKTQLGSLDKLISSPTKRMGSLRYPVMLPVPGSTLLNGWAVVSQVSSHIQQEPGSSGSGILFLKLFFDLQGIPLVLAGH